jgi:type II secretory pathway predicted ATPase ExeA
MYEDFYGFTELPFELTANPKYLYLSTAQREALSNLQYGLFAAKALTLLIGEAGTGKTTLIQAALASELCRAVRCVYLNNPTLRPDDFVRLLALKFELGREAGESKALLLERLETLLRERQAAGQITALVVDEAQSLSHDMLEEIRFLANIETPTAKLLPVVLAGQPELATRLEQPDLRQLKQRVTLRAVLRPFELEETAAYIATRIVAAGGVPGRVFSLEAVTLIHEFSWGIPRSISVICDNVLVNGMALGRTLIDRDTVMEVCRDLHLAPRPRSAPSAGAARDAAQISTPQPAPANAALPSGPQGDQLSQAAPNTARHERHRASLIAAAGRVGRTIT